MCLCCVTPIGTLRAVRPHQDSRLGEKATLSARHGQKSRRHLPQHFSRFGDRALGAVFSGEEKTRQASCLPPRPTRPKNGTRRRKKASSDFLIVMSVHRRRDPSIHCHHLRPARAPTRVTNPPQGTALIHEPTARRLAMGASSPHARDGRSHSATHHKP